MAIGTGAAIIGGSLASGILGSKSSKDAAQAQQQGNDAAIAEQRRQFDQILGLTEPGRNVGNQAMNSLAQMFIPGFTTPTAQPETPNRGFNGGRVRSRDGRGENFLPPRATNTPNTTGSPQNNISELFRNVPGVQFAIDETERAVGNSFASRGGAFGGNAIRALGDRAGNIAQDRGINTLMQLAGFGPSATGQAANAGANSSNAISQLLSNSGGAAANGILGSGGSINSAIQGGLNNFLLARALG